MTDEFCVAAHWSGEFDEEALQRWAEGLRQELRAPAVSLGLVFIAPALFAQARQVLEILRVHARIPLLAGCSSQALIIADRELEQDAGLVLGLYYLPGAELQAVQVTQDQVERAADDAFWTEQTGVEPAHTNGWLAFLDPFHLDCENWLRAWNRSYAPLPVMGGLASGVFTDQATQVYLNGEVLEEGGVAISVGGKVKLAGVTAQGCTPIGETWTLTRVERNIIHEIGNRPAYQVLAETFGKLSAEEQRHAQGNLFLGLVVNEYLDEFHRGDFLIRNLLGADPNSGSIAVGALPRQGQTVQFQRLSAAAATQDLEELLTRAGQSLKDRVVYGGCLCSCNGRGKHLFGRPNHDAQLVQQRLGPLGLTGFFCNGELGPVGERNFIHGHTASLALFVSQ